MVVKICGRHRPINIPSLRRCFWCARSVEELFAGPEKKFSRAGVDDDDRTDADGPTITTQRRNRHSRRGRPLRMSVHSGKDTKREPARLRNLRYICDGKSCSKASCLPQSASATTSSRDRSIPRHSRHRHHQRTRQSHHQHPHRFARTAKCPLQVQLPLHV